MPHWLLKAVTQRAISFIPAAHTWNALCRKFVTRSLDLDSAHFEKRLQACGTYLDDWRRHSGSASPPNSVLEFGTGPFPVVPLALHACGAERVLTLDIVSQLRPATSAWLPGGWWNTTMRAG